MGQKNQTHCQRGHEFTEQNTIVGPKGRRTCRSCKAVSDKQRRLNNREELQVYLKNWNLTVGRGKRLALAGWTPSMVIETLEKQKGLCSICGVRLVLPCEKGNPNNACADHEHVEPPRPRGLLCVTCNLMLGNAKDKPALLRSAAEYLELHQVLLA